jgi:hypothetical protein
MTEYNFNLITAFANSAPSNEIEAFPDYDRGLGIAFVETDGKPEMKGLNGLFSLLTVSLLALKQRGILTWTTGFEYKQGAFVVESNRLYQAKTDNTSKQPSLSQNDWQVWASVSDVDVDINGNIIKTAKAGGAFTLKVEDATTTVKGVARFATAIEIANKSGVSAAVTPSNASEIAQSTDLGVGQTWQNLTGSRSSGQTYTNNTGRPIQVLFIIKDTQGVGFSLRLNNVLIFNLNYDIPPSMFYPLSFIVPIGQDYSISWGGGLGSDLITWSELR